MNRVHQVNGERDPATSFPLAMTSDDGHERRLANRAVGLSAVGLALTGAIELAIALVSGSVALLGDALHDLSDVSTGLVVFVGIGIALVVWASAGLATFESVGNQVVARYKLRVGRRINSGTMLADATHSWLDALPSAGAAAGLVAVPAGVGWADASGIGRVVADRIGAALPDVRSFTWSARGV